MTRLAPALLAACLVLSSGLAYAQEDDTASPSGPRPPPPPVVMAPPPPSAPLPPAADAGDGRYTLHRLDNSFIRLDTRTGEVSTCGRAGPGWACQAVPDDRSALDNEIARLQRDNSALKTELLTHGLALPTGIKADPAAGKRPENSDVMPSDAQIDRAMSVVEKVWRRMVEIVANAQREIQQHKN